MPQLSVNKWGRLKGVGSHWREWLPTPFLTQYTATGPGSWKHAALGSSDEPDRPVPYNPAFQGSHWKHFHDALKEHQQEILNVILPRYGLQDPFEERV